MWGCEMSVEMIIDQWNPSNVRYRRETFCYGPKSCPAYKPGPTRKVPGRKGMSWEEEDWVDEEATAHRGPDEQPDLLYAGRNRHTLTNPALVNVQR